MLSVKLWIGLALIFLTACHAPFRVQTSVSPNLNPCRYKTYAFVTPEDKTLTHWLSAPEHRKRLEDLLREALEAHGLTEVAASGATPDLWIRQSLESKYNNDDKLGRWKVELAEGKDSSAVWSAQMEAVLSELDGGNLKHLATD